MNNRKQEYNLYASVYGELHIKTIVAYFKANKCLIVIAPIVIIFFLVKITWRSLVVKRNETAINHRSNYYVKSHSLLKVKDLIKPVALYLPQFHEIEDNNKWWGDGFTEWINVKRATSLFSFKDGEQHYQPHEPTNDLGYYDLSDVDVMRKQVNIAKLYGVFGFCFYYYYFENGKRLLEKPINNYLNATDIDFHFCFCWANENWTRVWDGGDKEILIKQDYMNENIANMIISMLPAFKDRRYIRINNKPVLFVYRAEIIPKFRNIVKIWQEIAIKNGLDNGLYIVSMQNFKRQNPLRFGINAAAEFSTACHKINPLIDKQSCISDEEIKRLSNLSMQFSSMDSLKRDMLYNYNRSYPCIRCVCPGWDNTPRRGVNNSALIYDSSPKNFASIYTVAIKETIASNCDCGGLLLINAWNEWGEGAHLEPDKKNGYKYLEKIKQIQNTFIGNLLDCKRREK